MTKMTNTNYDDLSEMLALAGISRTSEEIQQLAEVANYDYSENENEQQPFEIDSYSFKGKGGLPIRMTGNYADNAMVAQISESNDLLINDMNNLLEGIDISSPIKKWRANMDKTMTNEDFEVLGRAFASLLREDTYFNLKIFHDYFNSMETTDILEEYRDFVGTVKIDISEWVQRYGQAPTSNARRQWAFKMMNEAHFFNGYWNEAKEKMQTMARIKKINEVKLIP